MKKYIFLVLCLICLCSVVVPVCACAQESISVTSKEGILMSEDGQVLYERNALEKRPIASMTKIMTLLCIYDAVKQGKISLDDSVTVSSRASSMGGSQVFLDANATYKADNLVKSIIICSANDSCVAMAEHISGSVESFVSQMNDKCRQIGLVATHFENCTGLPVANHYSCAKDVATMFLHLIENPHYFSCANVWTEDFLHPSGRVTGMANTNKLVRFYQGCDGGKTGFTAEAQHCLSATAKRGDTRLIAVVVGASDSKTRFKEVTDLFNYGFANYESKVYLDKCDTQEVRVDGGKKATVEVAPERKLIAFGKKGGEQCTLQYCLPDCVKAPIKRGDVVGSAELVDANGKVVRSVDMIATADVQCRSYWDYVQDILLHG